MAKIPRVDQGQKPAPKTVYGASKIKETMARGEKICPDFNLGKCEAPCKNGLLHVCNVFCRRNRACGMRNHCALDCRNKLKA